MHYRVRLANRGFLFIGAITWFACASPTSRADPIAVLVPAYFYPGTGGPGGVGDGWATMAAAASQLPITAIFNPDSGPLPTVAGMNADLALAVQRNVGYVYVTDQDLPNPYAQLPSYWDQEVAAIDSIGSTPEPSGWILAILGATGCSFAAAIRKRRRERAEPVESLAGALG